jgi:signal transduction histidine kinase
VIFDPHTPVNTISREATIFGDGARTNENGLSVSRNASSSGHRKRQDSAEKYIRQSASSNNRSKELAETLHRLRNPATGIFSAAECMIEGDCGCLTETQAALLQGIMNSASAILNLLEEMTDKNKRI